MRLSAFFFEIIPLSGFFISAQYYNLIVAAIISLILSLFVIITFYLIERRISKFQILLFLCLVLLRCLLIYFNDETFVKIKPTIFMDFLVRFINWNFKWKSNDETIFWFSIFFK